MGRSSGAGFPLTLRCYACKRKYSYSLSLGRRRDTGTHLESTGRTRRGRYPRGHIHGIRQTDRQIEYRCLDCGHIGWTQHSDGEALLSRFQNPTPGHHSGRS